MILFSRFEKAWFRVFFMACLGNEGSGKDVPYPPVLTTGGGGRHPWSWNLVRFDTEPGDIELPSTIKLTSRLRIRTSDLFGDTPNPLYHLRFSHNKRWICIHFFLVCRWCTCLYCLVFQFRNFINPTGWSCYWSSTLKLLQVETVGVLVGYGSWKQCSFHVTTIIAPYLQLWKVSYDDYCTV